MLKNMTHNQEKNQSVKTNSKITQILEWEDKDVKTAIRNVFKYLKKKT